MIAFFEGDRKMPDELKKRDPSDKRSLPYKLLMTTDRYYVVASTVPDEQSIEVGKDSVAGMAVLK